MSSTIWQFITLRYYVWCHMCPLSFHRRFRSRQNIGGPRVCRFFRASISLSSSSSSSGLANLGRVFQNQKTRGKHRNPQVNDKKTVGKQSEINTKLKENHQKPEQHHKTTNSKRSEDLRKATRKPTENIWKTGKP